MKFGTTRINGVVLIELEPHHDARGSFARTYCRDTFARNGLDATVEQCNLSYNRRESTLRGLHLQRAPFGENKLVRCQTGAIYDVVVDLRPSSETYGCWASFELRAGDGRSLYIPEGVAHGFQTLMADTTVTYMMSKGYSPDHAVGLRYDDPALGIPWPRANPIVSERDRSFPTLETHDCAWSA